MRHFHDSRDQTAVDQFADRVRIVRNPRHNFASWTAVEEPERQRLQMVEQLLAQIEQHALAGEVDQLRMQPAQQPANEPETE
ncbi:hypothetical protein D3C84_685800 [compost metagenome]